MTFIVAQLDAQSVPTIEEKPVADDEEFETGALLIETDGEWVEAGADPDPADIVAVAEGPYGGDTGGFGGHGRREFPPGYMLGSLVRSGGKATRFLAEYTGTLPATNGGTYGVVRGTDSKWRVDFSETTADVVKLIDRQPFTRGGRPRVLVEFLAEVPA